MIVRRALREPFAARSWREVLYAVVGLPLGIVGLLAVLGTLLVTVLSTGIIIIPLLPLSWPWTVGWPESTAHWPAGCCG